MNTPTPKPDEMLLVGLKPAEAAATPPYLVYANTNRLLSQPECAAVIAAGEHKGFGYGTIGNGTNDSSYDDPEYRSVSVALLRPTDHDPSGQDLRWLYAKLAQHISWANQAYRFNLAGFAEPIQLLKYQMPENGRPAGHYKQHVDMGGGLSSLRKLSAVVQLSSPQDYDGCRLRIQTHNDTEVAERGQGDLIVFPSFTPHYVTALTRGTRYALAVWVGGPPFA